MAKKKTESAEKTESKTPVAKKAAPAKKPAAAPATGLPSINTSAAAAAAAALVGNKVSLGGGGTAKPESAAFKAMKDNLHKPTTGGVGNLLGSSGGQQKSNLPFAGGKQIGKNQTFGADVNRAGVPRRTGG
jgi:hypothetical protein